MILLKKKKINEFPTTVDKAVQCDNSDPYVRILIIEKLPKYTRPSDENFNNYLQQLQLTMEALKLDEKEKVSFYLDVYRDRHGKKLINAAQILIKILRGNMLQQRYKRYLILYK